MISPLKGDLSLQLDTFTTVGASQHSPVNKVAMCVTDFNQQTASRRWAHVVLTSWMTVVKNIVTLRRVVSSLVAQRDRICATKLILLWHWVCGDSCRVLKNSTACSHLIGGVQCRVLWQRCAEVDGMLLWMVLGSWRRLLADARNVGAVLRTVDTVKTLVSEAGELRSKVQRTRMAAAEAMSTLRHFNLLRSILFAWWQTVIDFRVDLPYMTRICAAAKRRLIVEASQNQMDFLAYVLYGWCRAVKLVQNTKACTSRAYQDTAQDSHYAACRWRTPDGSPRFVPMSTTSTASKSFSAADACRGTSAPTYLQRRTRSTPGTALTAWLAG